VDVRPVYETILTPRFHKPPVVHPYTEFITVDPVTALESKILRLDANRFNVPSSWSPDGSRLAISDERGLLLIVDVADTDRVEQVNSDVRGHFPSWNPEGSQIYLGGWLMQSDGTAIREVLQDAVDSLGVWSPDGTMLAVLSKGRLHIFDNFSPAFIMPDRPMDTDKLKLRDKYRLLKDLFKSGLISGSEFKVRKTKLLKNSGDDKK
jgi:WD40 repeat protein